MSNTNVLPDIRQSVLIDAPIAKVWEAVSTETGIAAWFMPPIGFQPVVGNEFKLNAGPFGMSPCKVTAVEPPHRLVFAWDKDWIVAFELEEEDGKTRYTATARHWTQEARDNHAAMGFEAGWNAATDQLEAIALTFAAAD